MKIAADFTQRVVVHSAQQPWVDSPIPQVQRKPLDRVGGEVARATTIVRFAPGSVFSAHVHGGGEEFVVLEGVFQDEHGDYGPGSYIRNPPQSAHTPYSREGCVILVKLWQFSPDDRIQVRLQIDAAEAAPKQCEGVVQRLLYRDAREDVSALILQPGTRYTLSAEGGAEVFVLQGEVRTAKEKLVKYSWLRAPVGDVLTLEARDSEAKLWIKTGHLRDVAQQIARVQASAD
ncbi:MAG: cupin domain-containing protein [Pseudomonadales bacterium]